jgi:hypothetical protein
MYPNSPLLRTLEHELYTSDDFQFALGTKGVLMVDSEHGMNHSSQGICKKAVETGHTEPENWIFKGYQFSNLLRKLDYERMNKFTIIHELMPWLVPSATILRVLGNEALQVLRTSFNVQWTCLLPFLTMLPHPALSNRGLHTRAT